MAATLETPEERSKKRTRYTEEEIERGLLVLALNGGRPQRASEQLASQYDQDTSESLLRYWRDQAHRDRYEAIAEREAHRIAQAVATDAEEIIAIASDLERDLLQDLYDKRAALDAKDVAGALRNVTTVKALNYDKISSPARGRPNTITEHRRSPEEILAGLKALGIEVVDADAEEIKEADVVPATLRAPTS